MEGKPFSARQVLDSLADMKSQIRRLTRRIEFLETKCENITRRYGSKGGAAPCNELWLVLSDERTRLTEQLRQVLAMERQVQAWLALLPKPLWRLVLQYRYLEGMSFQQVTEAVSRDAGHSYSIAQIYRFHRQALDAAETLWPLAG